MSCESCKRARYAIQIWFYEITGLRAIHDRTYKVIQRNHKSLCTNFNSLEANQTVLARQVRAANRTLQRDYAIMGNAVDVLERRLLALESPGESIDIIEPHKAN